MKLKALALFVVYALLFAAAGGGAFVAVRDTLERSRGVTYRSASEAPQTAAALGANVALDQYSDAEQTRALALLHDGGFVWVRQHFYWNEIEPQPGVFQWDAWDRIVTRASENGLRLIAVLDTSPAWARAEGEKDLAAAPPARVDDYAAFVSAFVRRYRGQVEYVQIWDNPNVHPFWGVRIADPTEYTALLRAGAVSARREDPAVRILSAGLAPNAEMIRGHPDYSDVLFLRGMYDAGARDYFDILGSKPYGMWSGPEDRRVSPDVFNFSRVLLLRDEMVAHGDATKPVMAVEMGWSALPAGWSGGASPWGSDGEAVQSARLAGAIRRARGEWPWMSALVIQTLQPAAERDDPLWGLALVDANWQPRPLYTAAVQAAAEPVTPASFDWSRFYLLLGALGLVVVAAVWRGTAAARRIPWGDAWRQLEGRFTRLPEGAQFALLALCVLAFYYSPNTFLNLVLLAPLLALVALRLDLGLAITVFTIPFYLLPKNLIGTMQFSLVEILTLVSVAAWLVRTALSGNVKFRIQNLKSVDYAVLLFVAVSLLSVKVAENFGVANREFRVIIVEPALLYGLIRASGFSSRDLKRLVNAFILSALAVALIGLYQYRFTDYVIIGEGVRRVLAVYGSPNNLALYLDRALPLLIALALPLAQRILEGRDWTLAGSGASDMAAGGGLEGPSPSPAQEHALRGSASAEAEAAVSLPVSLPAVDYAGAAALEQAHSSVNLQWIRGGGILSSARARLSIPYVLAALPIALCLYLTYSRGAWLFGLAAGLVFIGLVSGKRVRLAILTLMVLAALALVPFVQTERFRSFLEPGTGTGFFRWSVWQSGVAMIRDHPLFGVGLDNFLYQYPKYMLPEAWREPNLSHPHNIVLDFWVRMGILGVMLLIWMLVEFYRRGFKQLGGPNRILMIGLLASMTAALAHGMIDAAYFYVDLAFVFMLELALVVQLGDRGRGEEMTG